MRLEEHSPDEEIMALLDDELDAPAAARVRAHLDACDACAAVAQSFARTSSALRAWDVGPPSPVTPKVRDIQPLWRRLTLPHAALGAAAVLVLAVGATVMWQTSSMHEAPMSITMGGGPARGSAREPSGRTESAPGMVTMAGGGAGAPREAQPRGAANKAVVDGAAPPQARGDSPAQSGPLLVRQARLMLTAADIDAARRTLEKIVTDAGGFMGQLVASGSPRDQRSVSATVRVPSARFEVTLASLRQLGTVTGESHDAEDVTQQSADLDARLANARASEVRLNAILEQRTGRLSDVLDVEREISRVRGEIERMEAERKGLDRRITYAAIDVTILQEHTASIDFGPQPLSTRFRNAFLDGWLTALNAVVEAGLVVTSLLPSLIVLLPLLAPVALVARRHIRRAK